MTHVRWHTLWPDDPGEEEIERRFTERYFAKLFAPLRDDWALRKAIQLLVMHRLIWRVA